MRHASRTDMGEPPRILPVYLRLLWLSRLANAIHIRAIAEHAGITPAAYTRIEKGLVTPDARTWRLICQAVRQTALEDLLDGQNDAKAAG